MIANVHGGEPETILILGSDKRPEFGEEFGRSDTTILLRLDAEQGLISVMSIPRDLKTEIPGYGTEKFNAAYAYGGPKLTVQVVKELTGLKINHVVNIDFLGFVRAVDAIGCVYTDVDRRYYHSNVGLPAEEQYSEINIQPGYQKLCGVKALRVRPLPPHRHRHRPLGPPAELPRPGAPSGLAARPDHRQPQPDRHPRRIHDLRHHEGTELIELLDLLYELKGARSQPGPLPGRPGPEHRLPRTPTKSTTR